ncbi:ArsR/SmtB family transcription factor [Sphingobium lactosutens]|uniref:ArsR/SmtB family transcription factor n=1 Tax=Sphingobium lactosutens TaxID=522773 RepID=UPI00356688B8
MTAAQLDLIFGALSDPTRRAMLAQLARGESTVNALVEPSGLSQPTVSKHLKILEQAGLVSRGRAAQTRPVRLEAAPLAAAAQWIDHYKTFWTASYDRLDEYLQDLKGEES